MQNSLISINPAIRLGKPCIRTLRIRVYDILNMLASGMSYEYKLVRVYADKIEGIG